MSESNFRQLFALVIFYILLSKNTKMLVQNVEHVIIAIIKNSEEDKNMNLEILNMHRHEQQVVEEMKNHTDLFCEEKISDQIAVVELKKTDREGYFIHGEDGRYVIEYKCIPDMCRALLLLSGMEYQLQQEIREKCIFGDFGIMLDLSRNAVLKVETIRQMICYAACLGYKFVGLYMEDTFFVEEEPYFGYMRGRITHEEIRGLDSYAKVFGIELRPYIQTLAHLNQIARYERYDRIIDTKDILLVGDEHTEEFLNHVIKNISECFSSGFINIGMDEAELLGAGKYLTKNGFKKKSELMMAHLTMVLKICRKYHLRPQMWSDMFAHMLDNGDNNFTIPDELQIVYWDYYSTEEKRYNDNFEKLLSISSRLGFAGGAWKWTGFVPHNAYSILAGKASMKSCKEHGIDSYTVTCWGDDGAEASCFCVLPTFFKDASVAYESQMSDGAFEKLTGYKFSEFMKIDLVNPYLEDGKIHNNCSKYLLYNDPLIGTFDSVVKEDTTTRFGQAEIYMAQAASHGHLAYMFTNMQMLCRVLRHKADLGIRIRKAYTEGKKEELLAVAEKDIPVIRRYLDTFYDAFEKQWKKESKSFGFEIQTIRIGGLDRRLSDTARLLKQYVNGEIACIEELEETYQPFCYFEKNNIEELNYNLWSDIVSPSVIG